MATMSREPGFAASAEVPSRITRSSPATTVLDHSPGNNGSPADAGQALAPERAAAPPAADGAQRSPHARLPGLATTRWLCAAVTIDAELEQILDEGLEEQQRAVITTPGVDLVTVLKYALAGHHRWVVL